MTLSQVLVVDDEESVAGAIASMVNTHGYTAVVANNVEDAVQIFESAPVDLILSDVKMGRVGGLDLLRRVRDLDPLVPVVLITGEPTADHAIDAIRAGASDYLTKPVTSEHLAHILRKLILPREGRRAPGAAGIEEPLETSPGRIVGRSQGMIAAFTTVARVADEDTPVLILGENGTGKEVVARALHERSRRAQKPFVAVNVTAISPTLAESEFFGHERGSFTDAKSRHAGLFEQAQGGTLFLDEIGDLDPSLQAKILRAIQERRIKRVGGTEEIEVDARLVTATNRHLTEAVQSGRFRQDLYFRINVVTVRLPPLRDRPEDIGDLANYFLARHAQRSGRPRPVLTPAATDALLRYRWPGNVRELENVMQRALQFANRGQVTPGMLLLGEGARLERSERSVRAAAAFNVAGNATLHEVTRAYVEHVLDGADGNMTRAAEILGISRRTLQRWRLQT